MATKQERREQLRQRVKQNIKTKDSAGGGKVLNLSKMGDVSFFQPGKGKHLIDILPFVVKSKNHPQGLKPGDQDYVLDIYVHSWVGPSEATVLCLKKTFGKSCPICEEQAVLKKSDDVDEDDIKALNPKRKVIYNILDLEEEDKGIQLFDTSHFLFEKELLDRIESDGEEVITFADLEEGRSIEFRGTKDSFGSREFIRFKDFNFKKRPAYDEDVLEQTFSLDALLHVPTYDEVKAIFYGDDSNEDDDDSNKEDKPKKLSRKPVEEDDEDKPKKLARKSSQEDDDDDSPPAKKTLTRKSPSKDDESEPEDEKPAKKTLTRGEGKSSKKKDEEAECPSGHTFGVDCDEYKKDCGECDVWDACATEQETLIALQKNRDEKRKRK